jgi:hypothetical protein
VQWQCDAAKGLLNLMHVKVYARPLTSALLLYRAMNASMLSQYDAREGGGVHIAVDEVWCSATHQAVLSTCIVRTAHVYNVVHDLCTD